MPDYEDLILQRQEYYEILEDDPDTWIITPDEFMEIWEDKPDMDPKYYGGSCVVVPACLLEELEKL